MTAAVVDLIFPALGGPIPLDHGYLLYAALSRVLGPAVHDESIAAAEIGVFNIRGRAGGQVLALDTRSNLRVRLAPSRVGGVIALAGKALAVGSGRVRLGVPTVRPLAPAGELSARLVLIKLPDQAERGVTPERFLEAARRQLVALGISGEAYIPSQQCGAHAGQPQRRVMRVKSATRVGFSLVVRRLTPDESLRLQAAGIGGRRKMGCGLFLPTPETGGNA